MSYPGGQGGQQPHQQNPSDRPPLFQGPPIYSHNPGLSGPPQQHSSYGQVSSQFGSHGRPPVVAPGGASTLAPAQPTQSRQIISQNPPLYQRPPMYMSNPMGPPTNFPMHSTAPTSSIHNPPSTFIAHSGHPITNQPPIVPSGGFPPPMSSHISGGMGAAGGSRTHISGPSEGPIQHLQFTDEEQRQQFYRQKESGKVPAYSTLNLDVLPSPSFLQNLDKYQAKVDTELLKEMVKSAGMTTADDRVYKMLSAMMEIKLLDLLKEVRNVSATSNNAQQATGLRGNDPDVMLPKSQLQFEDLAKALEEEGVPLKRPAFLSEKPQQFQAQATTSQQLLAAAMASQKEQTQSMAQAQASVPQPEGEANGQHADAPPQNTGLF